MLLGPDSRMCLALVDSFGAARPHTSSSGSGPGLKCLAVCRKIGISNAQMCVHLRMHACTEIIYDRVSI